MRTLLLSFILLLSAGSAFANDNAVINELVRRDTVHCDREADSRYTWIVNMTNWRRAYNHCLRGRLRQLDSRYRPLTLEAIRLEEQCPEYMMNQAPVELSTLGMQIVMAYDAQEMATQATSNRLEETLRLYHGRTRQSVHRIRELRRVLGQP